MTRQALERSLLELILPDLEAEGYEVYAQPLARNLPAFLEGLSPDAIALRQDKKLVVEIVRDDADSKERLERLQRSLADQKDWELRVYLAKPLVEQRRLQSASPAAIRTSIQSVEYLVKDGQLHPALLMAWATFEALGRALMPEAFARPQTPARLIEVLAQGGQITPDEADVLRKLAQARNKLIHGELQTAVTKRDVTNFVKALKSLFELLAPKANAR